MILRCSDSNVNEKNNQRRNWMKESLMPMLYISKTVTFEYHYDYIKPQSIKI